jgi:ectoine hydroxylase-related dioxygenase (phytanoyl-CoA dioxygenase family)
VYHDEIATYPEDLTKTHRDSCIGLFVAGKPATKANGATRFIPGSHLWGDDRRPDESLTYYAELDVGDAFLMLGSCLHGGSANTTDDEERVSPAPEMMVADFYASLFSRFSRFEASCGTKRV